MSVATFTLRPRYVLSFSQHEAKRNQCLVGGLQIREGRFDSGTRLNYLAVSLFGVSTHLSTFTFRARSVPGRITAGNGRKDGG